MDVRTVGFVGLGRLGSVIATLLLDAGHQVVCSARGRSAELVAAGAVIAGDGSARAVAGAADIVFTCLPADGVAAITDGPDGLLAAAGRMPTVVELSTARLVDKLRLRAALLARDGELLDCPVSGTPAMVANRSGVIYGSGIRASYDEVAPLLRAISPGAVYVGELGAGTRMKYAAGLLTLLNVAATAETMAFATALRLDPYAVADVLARSPAATSGQFELRAPLIAAERFEASLVTTRDACEVLDQILETADEIGVAVPLAGTARAQFGRLGAATDSDSDPGRLATLLRSGRRDSDDPHV